jgi:hypothetical protein
LSGTSTSRHSDNRKQSRSEILKRWVGAPLTAAGLAAAGIIVTASPLFRATTIQVTGNHHVPQTSIIREAGLSRSTNVFWFHARPAQELLQRDPWVASATVSRKLPSTIRIRVTERRPASKVRVGSTWLLVAGDGTVLGPATPKVKLPILPSVDSLRVGRKSATLAIPARVAGDLDPWLRGRVRTLLPRPNGHLVLELAGGTHVLFGPPKALGAKERALAGILRWASHEGPRLAFVDLRAPSAPVARVGPA